MTRHEEIIRGVYRDLFETGDTDLADRLVTTDFVDHAAPPSPAPPGPDNLKATVAFLHSALGDIRYEVHEVLSAGNRAAYRATLTATQHGPLFGHPPTGGRFSMQQIHMVRFDGDRIAEHWACRDDLGALRQLGHLS
jgi:predicted ester cyclase